MHSSDSTNVGNSTFFPGILLANRVIEGKATYNDAREHLRKAEETSNLESEEEIGAKRKRKAKDIMLPGEESSDEDYMPKKKCKTNRVTVHPYPSLDSFSASFSSSPSTGMEVHEMWSSIPPNSLTPRPSSFSNAKIPPAPLASAPLASAHCPRKEKSAPLDVERIWLILGQLQAAAASQSEEISQLNRKIDL
ncbi:uncharacterized protein LOC126106189 [Schistocerca cancellata]|uniref:uncharacterized protein LOC126106189 n=1 Tax=Schistocerca cancellata TaxID=274614 RepID=UPI002117AF2B|nr:uncharacterized protein LOC126106189 [Schistocerca cancellata]